MSALSETLGNASGVPPHRIEANGKVYTARLFDDGLQVGYERRLYDKTVGIESDNFRRGIYDRETFDRRLDAVGERYTLGWYGFFGDVGTRVRQTPAGVLILVSLIFSIPEMEAVSLMGAKPAEVQAMLKLVLRESFPGLKFGKTAEQDGEAGAIAAKTEGEHPNSAGPAST